jgi:hypothetical protein
MMHQLCFLGLVYHAIFGQWLSGRKILLPNFSGRALLRSILKQKRDGMPRKSGGRKPISTELSDTDRKNLAAFD